MFENSKWLSFSKVEANLTRTAFTAGKAVKKAELRITALGYFEAFVNGERVSSDRLTPAMSEYEKRDLTGTHMPIYDTFSYTIYYLEYDVSALVKEGGNVLGVHIGSGWYGQTRSPNEGMPRWGDNCLVFELNIEYNDGTKESVFSSPDNTVWKESWIKECQLYYGEYHDLTCYDKNWTAPGYDDSEWKASPVRPAPEAELLPTTFPTDKVVRVIIPKKIFSWGDVDIYDLGETAAGVGVLRFRENSRPNEVAVVRYADVLNDDMSLNFHYCGGISRMQRDFFCNGDDEGLELYPHFTWHAARYIEVCGNADIVRFDIIQSDVRHTAKFDCDNKVIKWLYDTYILTQQSNIHGCVPSDCPHRERLGYTGDGQLTCDAVMTSFDAKDLYRKWLRDIRDSQDKENGHVQHTAPFYGGGGGPGGWGGAIVIVPYTYYKHYNDAQLVKEYLPSMKKYISYMLSHSEDGLVVREEKGGWCLGDWVPPFNKVLIPEAFVNTYYLAKCTSMLSELCRVCEDGDEAYYAGISENAGKALEKHFFNSETGSFCDGVQGADAFACDLGIGDERTLCNLVKKYTEKCTFDTGIFGTDILIRVLFEKGSPELAAKLLANTEKDTSFGWMMQAGATTLWENWNGCDSRSHPMYGAVTSYFFRYILGIRLVHGEIRVKPAYLPDTVGNCYGERVIGDKKVFVKVTYENGEQKTEVSILPVNVSL